MLGTALKITGRQGKFSFVNDCYEPMTIQHNGKPIWVARSASSKYIFHTGKSRWVVSRCMDDGFRCWAFVPDTGAPDPSGCSGPWTFGDNMKKSGGWTEDASVSCQQTPACNDKFVQLRLSIEKELRDMGLVENTDLKKLWRRLDYNGNGIVSLAEIDKMVVELTKAGTWPEWLNNKPALMRAYKKATLKDGNGDDWVQKFEFHALLLNIFWFNKLWLIFIKMAAQDDRADRRLNVDEFCSGMQSLGLNLSRDEAAAEFAKIDRNHGGQVLFVEFCAYIRTRVNPDDNPEFDADIYSGEHCGKSMRKHHGHHATKAHVIRKKTFKDFDELEKQIQQIMSDNKRLHDLWKRLDFNGNNIVSLAEIDKLAVEKYPLLNHKPALMRAYKATIKAPDANGDDWVNKKEFKTLLGNLFYFNKIFWIFDHADPDRYHDRRLTFKEFQHVLVMCGTPMHKHEAHAEFQKIDKNGGGIVLFDEFCKWFTSKQCPQAMMDLIS